MVTYPRLLRRVQAVLIDSLIIPIVFIGVMLLVAQFNVENIYIKVSALILPFLILEPGLVAFTGGTIGHHILKIKVRSSKNDANLNIIFAVVRFVVKFILGWLSFVFILTTDKHQAIHDIVSGSIVVNIKSEGLSDKEALKERTESVGWRYPSAKRRTIVITYIQHCYIHYFQPDNWLILINKLPRIQSL